MNKKRSNLKSTLQMLVLLCIAPLLFALCGSYYVQKIDSAMRKDMLRNLSDMTSQGAEIIEARLRNRIDLLENVVAQPIMLDPAIPREQKISFLRRESERRNLLRMGLVNLRGQGFTTDGYSLDVDHRLFFQKARAGISCISEVLMCKIQNVPVVVHTVPVRDLEGHIYGVLFATEKAANLSNLLRSGFAYNSKGMSRLVDSNGILLSSNDAGRENFYELMAAENGTSTAAMHAKLYSNEHALTPIMSYGVRSFVNMFEVQGSDGWHLITIVPEKSASEDLNDIMHLTLGSLGLTMLLLVCCGMGMLALRRGYLRQRGIASAAVESAGLYHVRLDEKGQVTDCNDLFLKHMGWERIPQGTLDQFAMGSSAEDLEEKLYKKAPFMLCLKGNNGEALYVQWHIMPERGKAYTLLGTDFSARQQDVENQHAAASMRDFRQIFDNIPAPMALHDTNNYVLVANKTLQELVGDDWSAIDKRFGGRTPAHEVKTLDDAFFEVVKTGKSVVVPHTICEANGTVRHYRNSQSPLFDDQRQVTSVISLSVDITDSLRVEEHLKQEVQRLRDLLDTSPVGVIITVDGVVNFSNLRARQMVGLQAGAPLQTTGLVVEGDPQQVLEKLKIMPIVRDIPIVVRDPRKRLRHLLVTASRANLEGQPAIIIWAVDVTPMKEAEMQLIQARDGAEQATRAKSDFLATMSHEIRTPMNAVLGFLHLFDRENLTDNQLDYLEKISISATGLLRIINDILDFSKIEAGKLIMEQLPYNLASCVNAVHSIIDFSAKDKGLELSSFIEESVPDIVIGDRERLNQVLINLLNNAVKFTPKGFVRLRVNVRERHADGHILLGFTIEDSGIGMSTEQIDRVFQPFSQADTSVSRRFGGTGLGLVISRRLVELMGGKINMTSTEGKGTTFDFTIACREADNSVTLAEGAGEGQGETAFKALAGSQLLVVEDNEINQEIAGAMLTQLNMEVDFACNGQVALEMVAMKDYALIFMDMQMPVMDGLTATQRIRAMAYTRPNLATVPIIAMTANAMLDDRKRCLEAGMNAHIAKPIEPQTLQKILQQWLPQPVDIS